MLTDKKNQYCNPEIWGGIECTINRVGDSFFDQLDYSGFYNHPEVDAIINLGIKKLRFPVLWEKHQPSLQQDIDWNWTEQQLLKLKHHHVDVIAGLVHHGSGPAFTNLLDDNFPYLLAAYAKKVAEKFPWINYYTPVNEPLTTARFSGLYGLWYPHKKNDKSFLKMLLNELKGVVLSMQEIRKVNPSAQLIQTEDLGKTYSTPLLKYQADFENERRWLPYDLLCGKVNEMHPLWKFFINNGFTSEDLEFFQQNICIPDIFGFNHYVTSERYLDQNIKRYPKHTHGGNRKHRYADVEVVRVEVEEETGIKVLLKEAWERYRQPIAVTEVHLHCHREEQLRWFEYVWNCCTKLAKNGVDIKGVTAWAMFGSYGWNTLLTQPNGEYEPGVFDMRSGKARPTALRNYIRELTGKSFLTHHLAKGKGWWQRDCRYIYVPSFSLKMKALNSEQRPILIIGKNGTLGRAFAKICEDRMLSYKLLSRKDCDIAEMQSIESAIDFYKPWAIINAAGYVRVDDAEREQEKCFRENMLGPVNLSNACKNHGIKLITFSSDLVFNGEKTTPYVETDAVSPLNVYGISKAQSEEQIVANNSDALIVRTSAFFGPWDQYNFVHCILNNVENSLATPIANDVMISPTYVPDLVNATLDLLVDDEKGIWHLANKGAISWYEFAQESVRKFNLDTSFLQPVSVMELDYLAARPKYSVLGSEKGYLLPSLENAIQRFFDEKKVDSLSSVAD